jgi:hypothetical protein
MQVDSHRSTSFAKTEIPYPSLTYLRAPGAPGRRPSHLSTCHPSCFHCCRDGSHGASCTYLATCFPRWRLQSSPGCRGCPTCSPRTDPLARRQSPRPGHAPPRDRPVRSDHTGVHSDLGMSVVADTVVGCSGPGDTVADCILAEDIGPGPGEGNCNPAWVHRCILCQYQARTGPRCTN